MVPVCFATRDATCGKLDTQLRRQKWCQLAKECLAETPSQAGQDALQEKGLVSASWQNELPRMLSSHFRSGASPGHPADPMRSALLRLQWGSTGFQSDLLLSLHGSIVIDWLNGDHSGPTEPIAWAAAQLWCHLVASRWEDSEVALDFLVSPRPEFVQVSSAHKHRHECPMNLRGCRMCDPLNIGMAHVAGGTIVFTMFSSDPWGWLNHIATICRPYIGIWARW